MHGIFSLTKAAEAAREWDIPIYVAQLDLKKAFDHVDRSAAVDALKLQGASLHTIAWIVKLWMEHSLEMRMGPVTSQRFATTRGLPQGAPESPVVFTIIVEMVMRKLQAKWSCKKKKKHGFLLDSWWFPCLAYADDIILIARSKKALEEMIADASAAFEEVGLSIGHDKTNWSSHPPLPNHVLKAGPASVTWKASLIFVGVELSLLGSSTLAVTHRMAQAQSTFSKWRPLLSCPWVSPIRRCGLLAKSVWPSFLWGAACWNPTKAIRRKISSWGARMAATTAGIKRAPEEAIGCWWRRMHRAGHKILDKLSLDPEKERRRTLHRWAGHVARMPTSSQPAQALRTRGLQWWRHAQEHHEDKKWSGVHCRRFGCWRWEAQLGVFHGDGSSADETANTGWLRSAQDRVGWRCLEENFL